MHTGRETKRPKNLLAEELKKTFSKEGSLQHPLPPPAAPASSSFYNCPEDHAPRANIALSTRTYPPTPHPPRCMALSPPPPFIERRWVFQTKYQKKKAERERVTKSKRDQLKRNITWHESFYLTFPSPPPPEASPLSLPHPVLVQHSPSPLGPTSGGAEACRERGGPQTQSLFFFRTPKPGKGNMGGV